MISTVIRTNNSKRLMAAVAVLALIACAFVAFMPSAEATVSETVISGDTPVPTDGQLEAGKSYVIMSSDNEAVNITLPASGDYAITLYLAEGTTLNLVGTANTGTVTIYAANSTGEKYLSNNDTKVTVANLDGTITVTSDYGSGVANATVSSSIYLSSTASVGGTITGTATTDNDTDGIVGVAANSTLTTGSAATLDYGIEVKNSATEYIYYPAGSSVSVSIADSSDSVSVKNGTAIITQGTSPNTNTISLQNIVSSTAVAVTFDSVMKVSGGVTGATGSITMTSGTVTIGSSLTLGDMTLNAYANAAATDGTIIGATPAVAGATQEGAAWVLSSGLVIYGTKSDDIIIPANAVTDDTTPSALVFLQANSTFDGSISVRGMESDTPINTVEIIDGTISSTSSINIAGQYVNPTSGADSAYITFTSGIALNDVVVYGEIKTTNLNILAGQSVEFSGNGKITDSGTVTVLGEVTGTATKQQITATTAVQASDVAYVQMYSSNEVTAAAATSASQDNFVELVNQGYKEITLTLTGDLNLTDGSLELDGVNVTISGNYNINVNEGYSLTFTDSTVRLADGCTAKINVNDGSSMDIVESNLFIEVIVADGATVSSVGNTAVADNITGDINVGFGATQTLSGTISQGLNVYVWGTLVVPADGTLTVDAGGSLVTKSGATVTVDGTMNIAGTVNIVADASMTVSENGAVSVNGTNGNAQLNNRGKITVDGTVSVTTPNTGRPANIIDAGEDFTVNGTMNVTGTVQGEIQDKGTITFNGTAGTSLQITIYSGVTLTVTSVTNEMTITDAGIMLEQYGNAATPAVNDYRAGVYVSDGNTITLTDVRGVTVSETVSDQVRNSNRYVVCDMHISGNVSYVGTPVENTPNGEIEVGGTPVACNGNANYLGQVYVDAALTLGQGVHMTNGQNLTVTAEGSIVTTAQDAALYNNATITVEGTVTFSDKSDVNSVSGVNAVMYRVTDNTDGTYIVTYTNFAAAVAAIGGADDSKITAYGNVSVSAEATIASGQTLDIQGTLTVDNGVLLTAATGGKITGAASARIDVNGTFTAQNKVADVSVRDIVADVIIDNSPAITYTNLANAIALGETQIIINNEIDISESMTIPEGVTVTSDYPVHVNENVVLTVDGTLAVSAKGSLDNKTTSAYDSTEDVLGEITVTGTVSVVNGSDTSGILYQVDGAHYSKTVGAFTTCYVTGLDIAAASVDNTIVDMIITVYGTVNADGEITFAVPANADALSIVVAPMSASDEKTVVSVGTLVLDGAMLAIFDDATFNGTVNASAADGTASVTLRNASNMGLMSAEVEDANGTTDYLYLGSAVVSSTAVSISGTVTVAAGTVTVIEDLIANAEDAVLNVASGATLSVPAGTALTAGMTGNINNGTNAPAVTIDGTLDVVRGTVTVTYGMIVNGTMNVSKSTGTAGVSVDKGATLSILGTLSISQENNNEGSVRVSGTVAIGSKPTSLGVDGTVTGTMTVAAAGGVVKVYSGTVGDVTYNSQDAPSTTIYINGVEYMTVYTGSGQTVNDILKNDDIQLAGLDTPAGTSDDPFVLYTDAELTKKLTSNPAVGTYDAIYTEFDPAIVNGIVTVGAGINLYIDGIQVYGYGDVVSGTNLQLTVGDHRVSYEIKAGWDGSSVVFTWNGQTIQNNSTITVTADMTSFTLSATGAINSTGVSGGDSGSSSSDDGMGLTDYLLIVLVILIVVMAIMVALRLMRS